MFCLGGGIGIHSEVNVFVFTLINSSMKTIESYMLLSKTERQAHVDRQEECLERGGNSTCHRGVLAQYLGTVIPMKRTAILAHACNNPECSNPRHLYWATDSENIVEDGIEFGTWKSAWERTVDKYGYKEACAMRGRQKAGNTNAAGNKGKPKSEEHKRKIAEAIRKKHAERQSKE